MVIAVIGSGGKTTRIHELADFYRAQGKTVFVTATTHMFLEEDTIPEDDLPAILHALQHNGYAMAGISDGIKISPLSPETYAAACAAADITLVEADGSRHKALKFPSPKEPVIPDNTDEIILVWGRHGLGKPARLACHRLELVKACLDIEDDTVITKAHVEKLLQEGYLTPLKKRYPHIPVQIHTGDEVPHSPDDP